MASVLSQDDVYLPIKFINDNASLTDAQLVSALTTALTGNAFAHGIIGCLMKFRNPAFDTSSYQTDMNVVINHCIEFLLLRFDRQLDGSTTLSRFIQKVLTLTNLQYAMTLIAFLLQQNVIVRNGQELDLNYVANSYLTAFSNTVPSGSILLNVNLIPVIQSLVFNANNKVVNLSITLLNPSTSNIVNVSTDLSGKFPLFPQQQFQLQVDEDKLMIDRLCTISLSYLVADLSAFLYTSQILSALQ
jgi:hypothetical protein